MTADEPVEGRPSFVHLLSSGCTEVDEPIRLTREQQAELDRRLDEMAEARARAEVSGRDYIIWR